MSNDCPVCGSENSVNVRRSSAAPEVGAEDLRITDARYGQTGPLYRCTECGFLFVRFSADLTKLYEDMIDPDYEKGRSYRCAQQRQILQHLSGRKPGIQRILDVGAGTGMLVEEALRLGLQPVGIEPSRWAVKQALQRGLPVFQGVLPHPDIQPASYDAVLLLDVIEHVQEPVDLLKTCREYLLPDGVLLVITPDVASVAARLLGFRWWHYRLAHVGYFSLPTLKRALQRAGLRPMAVRRPAWVFEVSYLYQRLRRYVKLPAFDQNPSRGFSWLMSRQIGLNLRDSIEVLACRA